MALITSVCPKCNETINLDDSKPFGFCMSCGAKVQSNTSSRIQGIGVTQMIENFYILAQNANNAKNYQEAEQYCNKIIELDPSNCEAWLLKGHAAGWQSALGSIRFSEAVICFGNALTNSTNEEMHNHIIEASRDDVMELSAALIMLRCQRFEKWPDSDEATGINSSLRDILDVVSVYVRNMGSSISINDIMRPIAKIINETVVSTWNQKILPEFNNDNDGKPDDYALSTYIDRADNCIRSLNAAVIVCTDDDESDLKIYTSIVSIHNSLIKAKSYDYEYYDGNKQWNISKTLSQSAMTARFVFINEAEKKMTEIKNKIYVKKQEQIKAYWEVHLVEKNELGQELQMLKSVVEKYDNEKKSILKDPRIAKMSEEMLALETLKKSLNVFKIKEKKLAEDRISKLERDIKKEKENILSSIEAKLSVAKTRLNAIIDELTKERPEM